MLSGGILAASKKVGEDLSERDLSSRRSGFVVTSLEGLISTRLKCTFWRKRCVIRDEANSVLGTLKRYASRISVMYELKHRSCSASVISGPSFVKSTAFVPVSGELGSKFHIDKE